MTIHLHVLPWCNPHWRIYFFGVARAIRSNTVSPWNSVRVLQSLQNRTFEVPQRTPAMALCNICSSISLESLRTEQYGGRDGFQHHSTSHRLRSSSDSCNLCALIHDKLQHHFEEHGLTECGQIVLHQNGRSPSVTMSAHDPVYAKRQEYWSHSYPLATISPAFCLISGV